MKNEEALKQVNKKLKLYRHTSYGTCAKWLILATGCGTIGLVIGKAFSIDISNNVIQALVKSSLYATAVAPINTLLCFEFNELDYQDKINFLKKLKKELKNGTNRFENVYPTNFDMYYEQFLLEEKAKVKTK